MWGGRTHTEIDWLLPGCTMDRMRERADRFRPFWEATDGRLRAKVREDRLTAIVVRLGPNRRRGPLLRARLSPEGEGIRMRGRVARSDLITLVTGYGAVVVTAGLTVAVAIQQSPTAPATLAAATFTALWAWMARDIRPKVGPNYQADLLELEGKVRSRFSGYRPPGVPWVEEPAHGAGNSPFRARPLIRFGRRPR